MNPSQLYTYLLRAECFFAILTFFSLLFITAPYGRFARLGWGPSIPARLGWMIMESPAVLLPAYIFFKTSGLNDLILVLFFLIWQLHYFHRAFIYPFRKTGGHKPFPLLLVGLAIVFNLMNGYINSYEVFVYNSYEKDWCYQWPFIIGSTLFFIGFFLNKQSDAILSALRQPGETRYSMPFGGAFKWVSNPHYLGELLEWCGWAVLTWSVAGWAFVAYTFANLAPRALAHHRWYVATFEKYPAERKILIPFIW